MTRVHAVLVSRAATPLPVPLLQPTLACTAALLPLRQAALEVLSAALGGDVLAAEYVLMLTLQRVTGRWVEGGGKGGGGGAVLSAVLAGDALAAEYVLMLTLVASATLHVQVLQTCMPGGHCPLLTFATSPACNMLSLERKKERKKALP